ncbi:MAG: hypothetical protein JWL77_876 [Chthonomonadaceae bacterium]|nr:hypothetical protein [Chthonomonadaceae bacterium]
MVWTVVTAIATLISAGKQSEKGELCRDSLYFTVSLLRSRRR